MLLFVLAALALCGAAAGRRVTGEKDPFNIYMPCASAFEKYIRHFSKTYSGPQERAQALSAFCENLAFIREARQNRTTLTEYGVTHMMDMDLKRMPGYYQDRSLRTMLGFSRPAAASQASPEPRAGVAVDEYNILTSGTARRENGMYPFLDAENETLAALKNIDLREVGLSTPAKDQGSCGSCYNFVTTQIYESLILRDMPIYKKLKLSTEPSKTWTPSCSAPSQLEGDGALTGGMGEEQDASNAPVDGSGDGSGEGEAGPSGTYANWAIYDANNLALSQQFLLNNHVGCGEDMCGGGNYMDLVTSVITRNIPLSLYNDCRYKMYGVLYEKDHSFKGCWEETCPNYTQPFMQPIRLIPDNNEAVAVYYVHTDSIDSETKVIDLAKHEEFINKLKLVLSRGIAVAGSMSMNGGFEGMEKQFQNYKGGIFDALGCAPGTYQNHQISWYGIGYYKGRHVLLGRNTWGSLWGIFGFFYVEVGRNMLCLEEEFAYSLPRFFAADPNVDSVAADYAYADEIYEPFLNATLRESILKAGPFASKLKRCSTGFDDFDETGFSSCSTEGITIGLLVVIMVVGIILFFFLRYCFRYMFCAPDYVFKGPRYLKLPGDLALAAAAKAEMANRAAKGMSPGESSEGEA